MLVEKLTNKTKRNRFPQIEIERSTNLNGRCKQRLTWSLTMSQQIRISALTFGFCMFLRSKLYSNQIRGESVKY